MHSADWPARSNRGRIYAKELYRLCNGFSKLRASVMGDDNGTLVSVRLGGEAVGFGYRGKGKNHGNRR